MEKTPNFSEEIATDWESKKELIKNRLIQLCKQPPSYEELSPLFEATSSIALWNIYSKEKKNQIKKAENVLENFSVQLYSLPELRYGMEEITRLMFDNSFHTPESLNKIMSSDNIIKDIESDLAHENAHMNIAESLGVKGKMYLIIPYTRWGGLSSSYMAVIEKFPDHWSLEKSIDVGIKMNEAPEVYDEQGKLSEFDKNEIEKLKSSFN